MYCLSLSLSRSCTVTKTREELYEGFTTRGNITTNKGGKVQRGNQEGINKVSQDRGEIIYWIKLENMINYGSEK